MERAGARIGDWLLEGELARGGMGVVFRARHRVSGDPAALKLLLGAAPAQRTRFAREAAALARIRHPHLVRLIASGEDQGRPFLALELIAGQTLGQRLARMGPLGPQETVELARRLASALEALHAAGLVHRDVKPDNVLLGDDGRPRLVDLGLVKDLDPATDGLSRSGVFLGTPGWWAPEQALGRPERIGPHTDIYGLGALLYACLTGQPPHPAGDLAEAIARAERGAPPPPPSTLAPGTSPALDALVLRCLAARPEERYPTASALGAALEALSSGRPGTQAEPGLRLAGPLLLGGVVLLLGIGAALALRRPAAPVPGQPAPPAPPARAEVAPARSSAATPQPAAPDEVPPGEVNQLIARGSARLAQGDLDGALTDFDRVLLLQPDEPIGLVGRSQAWARLGDTAQAMADAARYLERHPTGLSVHLLRDDLQRVRAPRAGDATPAQLVNRGVQRERLGDLAAAERDYTRALELDPGRAVAWIDRAALRGQRGDYRGAAADASRAITLDPADPDGWINRAQARQVQGDLHGALADWDRALALDPGHAVALCNRALVRSQTGDPAGARVDAERCLELAPTGPTAPPLRQLLAELDAR